MPQINQQRWPPLPIHCQFQGLNLRGDFCPYLFVAVGGMVSFLVDSEGGEENDFFIFSFFPCVLDSVTPYIPANAVLERESSIAIQYGYIQRQ